MTKMLAVLALALTLASAQAATTEFDLFGRSGAGLLSGNENPTPTGAGTPGSGGELGAGIFFNDLTRILTINVGWGSGNGFANLTGNATLGHIHGPTAAGGTASYTQNASPRYDLHTIVGSWNPSASAGGFNGTVTIAEGDVSALFNGQFYLNFHTGSNPGGEIRGNLVPVPEPSTYALFALGGLGLLGWMRRRVC